MNPRIPQIIADLAQFESKLRQAQSAEDIAKQLGNIKLYAAQLYLETDMEIIAQSGEPFASDPQPIEEVSNSASSFFRPSFEDDIDTQDPPTPKVNSISSAEKVPAEEQLVKANEETESVISHMEEPIERELPEVEIKEITESPEIVEVSQSEEVTLPTADAVEDYEEEADLSQEELQISQNELEESVPDEATSPIVTDSEPRIDLFSQIHLKTVENTDNVEDNSQEKKPAPHLEQRATEILAMFSFSRRFEFGNFLFGGDMKLFAVFITEMLAASDADQREDVFDTWYTQRQWSRRDESANDLKRNLRKMI